MRLHTALIAVPCLALAAVPVKAQTQASQRQANFRDWDTNRNGVLEKYEFLGHPGNFDAMDANRDGVLSRDEFVDRYRGGEDAPSLNGARGYGDRAYGDNGLRGARLGEFDRNNDGALSRSEWKRQPQNQRLAFFRADRNGDGVISESEFRDQPDANVAESAYDQYDVNNNGMLERREWPRVAEVSFDRADVDRNGEVTFPEYMSPPPVGYRDGRPDRGGRYDRDGRSDRDGYYDRDGRYDRDGVARDRAHFASLDRNRDGWVSLSEFDEGRSTFYRLDRNRDHRLSPDELAF